MYEVIFISLIEFFMGKLHFMKLAWPMELRVILEKHGALISTNVFFLNTTQRVANKWEDLNMCCKQELINRVAWL